MVVSGIGVSKALEIFEGSESPTLLPAMVKVAEEAGNLHSMIYRFCDIVKDEMQSKVSTFTALLEPLLMGGMGFVVGTILLAAFLPVYQLVSV